MSEDETEVVETPEGMPSWADRLKARHDASTKAPVPETRRCAVLVQLDMKDDGNLDFELEINSPCEILNCWFVEQKPDPNAVKVVGQKIKTKVLPVLCVDSDPSLPLIKRQFSFAPANAEIGVMGKCKLVPIGAYAAGSQVMAIYERFPEPQES